MSQAVLPITGYLDRFSARPGEDVVARISLRAAGPYRARLVRVICGDPNPDGPGMQFEDLSARLDRTLQGQHQQIQIGSYGLVPKGPARNPAAPCTWTVLIWTANLGGHATLVSDGDLRIGCDSVGVFAELAGPNGSVRINTGTPLRPRQWYRVWLSADPITGHVVVGQQALGSEDSVHTSGQLPGLRLPSAAAIMFAADTPSAPRHHFTGKLEAPAILAGFVNDWSIPAPPVLAAWDFAIGIPTQVITDTGPQACHGQLVNLPARGMVGAGWTGREMCWRHAPQDYAAIQFHDGDLDDCGWDADFAWTVPPDMPSGAYALQLTSDEGQDTIPFYVLPNRGGPFASVAFLASTFTYQAYANHARGNADTAYKARAAAWGASPYNPDDYPIYGRSTYNRHADNSGIGISSRRRPILTMRPGFLTFDDPHGSGLRHYPADTHLLAWLEAKGIAFDVITDEDLDNEGPALLAPYRAVLTGSHPEYHTPNTWTRCSTTQTPAANSPTSAATASTGASRACPNFPTSSNFAVPRAASVLGRPNPANTTTSLMANMAAFGAATAARRKCWPASVSLAKASSKAPTTAACPPRMIRTTLGSLPASTARSSATTASPAAVRPASNSTAQTRFSARPPMRRSWRARKTPRHRSSRYRKSSSRICTPSAAKNQTH